MNRRALVVGLLIGVLVVIGFVDDRRDDDRTETTQSETTLATTGLQPIAAPAGALSSTFYCAGGTAVPDGAFDQTIIIANPSPEPITASITSYPGALDGDADQAAAVAALKPVTTTVEVGARAREEVRLADMQQSPYAAAIVEAAGGELAVEHRVTGKLGTDSGPCASSASASWYLPTGTTTKDARELLALFNPFPGDAVLDMEFATSEGHRDPSRYRNYVVPGGQLRIVDIGTELQRHEHVATSLVARSGRVIVERLQLFDGSESAHPAGIGATLAAASPAPVWTFPEGVVSEGITETFTLFNPGDGEALVDLEVVFDQPDVNGTVDPIPVSVPSRGYSQVKINDQQRVPPNVGHSVTARSTNGVPVVVERVVTAVSPAARRGYAPTLGSPLVATRWLFADGGADANTTESLSVFNPGDSIARLTVHVLAQGQDMVVDGLREVEVAPHGRLVIDVGAHLPRPDLPMLIEVSQPVVVERGLAAVGKAGISLAVGIPLADSLAEPPRSAPVTTTTAPPPVTDEPTTDEPTTDEPISTTAPTTSLPPAN